MKSLIQAVVVAAAFAAPVVSFAQSNQPVSRTQVRAELLLLEKAGYSPHGRDPYYPADIQAAEARVAAQNGAARAENTGFGGASSGLSQSGVSAANTSGKSIYAGH
ncbi:hypothetical protein EOS_16770 [Caballeronia mineralivorans PML1(12)]|uniref:Purine nucleoside phosphorylase n=1 Tax=Caballeronia mineralivorans PML1(12) TaxID=908627 RepID=A0A0J1FYR0_9BURK|nr:DUF4148 domain-containing protein [Caballeronia mineralivorans]KLU25083.1 hypothetical protein EOS_16770 [Caballeronia mineralivorans PML1(12)]